MHRFGSVFVFGSFLNIFGSFFGSFWIGFGSVLDRNINADRTFGDIGPQALHDLSVYPSLTPAQSLCFAICFQARIGTCLPHKAMLSNFANALHIWQHELAEPTGNASPSLRGYLNSWFEGVCLSTLVILNPSADASLPVSLGSRGSAPSTGRAFPLRFTPSKESRTWEPYS